MTLPSVSRIFLIEDDPTMVDLLEMLFKMENYFTGKIEKEDTGLILAQLDRIQTRYHSTGCLS